MAATMAATVSIPTLPTKKRDVRTKLNFYPPSAEKILLLDFRLPEAGKEYAELSKKDVSHDVVIQDVRGEEHNYTLERNGFSYVKHEVKELKDCSTEEQIKALLIPATEELVKQTTGANKVITFTHRIRCLAVDERRGADNTAPAHRTHSDFTKAGALHHLETLVKDPAEREQLLKGRVLAINVWRPLKTITRDPLTVCDWATVNPDTDLGGFRMIFPTSWNELGKINFSEKQKWCYLSQQTPDEPVVFMQFDNRNETGYTLPHSAFVDPEYSDGEVRESIEIKMFAFLSD